MAGMKTLFRLVALTASLSTAGCQSIADRYIEDYLERNGAQMMQRLSSRQRQMDSQQMEEQFERQLKTPVSIPLDGSPSLGPDSAPVTIVTFSDFECPFCARAVPTLKQLLQSYPGKIRLVFKHLPLPMHKNAGSAARAAIAAQAQGKFWEMHDRIFENQRSLDAASLEKLARELKLDLKRFNRDSQASSAQSRMIEDMSTASRLGVRSTPSFFMNGAMVKGALPLDQWNRLIAKIIMPRG